MNKTSSVWRIRKFDPDTGQKYKRFIERRTRPIIAFVYWIGGILPLAFTLVDYFHLPEKFDELLVIRGTYFVFWAAISLATISRWRFISINNSLLIYIAVGMFYVTHLNMQVTDRYIQVVPLAIFYLFSIIMCQQGPRMAMNAGAVCVIVPTGFLILIDKLQSSEQLIIVMLIIWAFVAAFASLAFEKMNRSLFISELRINETNKTNKTLLAKEAKANKFKSEFLAKMSHEIRTPLTAILGYAESYLEGDFSRETQTSTVQTIHHNGEHLLNLVNDILDLSKIEAGKLTLENAETNLFTLLQEVSDLQKGLSRAKNLTFQLNYNYPLPDKIITDHTRLKQVLINLITNAIKFTEQGGIEIDVHYQPELEQLHFIVSDTGIGMSESVCEKLFEAYSQASHEYGKSYGGTGLGLYISRQLVEKLGGEIQVVSEEGKGSSFSFYVKINKAPTCTLLDKKPIPPKEPITSKVQTRLSGHVLLAEDNDDNRKLISLKLQQLGLTVVEAKNGLEASEQTLRNEFDVVLMDIEMPLLTGEDAITIIRATDTDTPVLALTANAMPQDIERYIQLGFNAHLAKPIEQQKFVATLRKYCKVIEAQEDTITNNDETGVFSLHDVTYQQLVAEYVKGLPCEIELLKHAKSAHDWAKLAKVAHNLKGSAGNFGFNHISDDAGNLESLVKEQSLGEIDTAFNRLMGTLSEALYSNEQ